jgi:hypothetical protein
MSDQITKAFNKEFIDMFREEVAKVEGLAERINKLRGSL